MLAGTTLRLALMGEPTVGSEEGELLCAAACGSEARSGIFPIPKHMSKWGSVQDWGPWKREGGQPSLAVALEDLGYKDQAGRAMEPCPGWVSWGNFPLPVGGTALCPHLNSFGS